jgi:hypothetical protein
MMWAAFADWMRTAQLQRGIAGTYEPDGEWVPAFDPAESITIIIPQPVKANDLVQLDDGEHLRNYRKTWTDTLVKTREGDVDADRIIYNGRTYKVFEARDWTEPEWAGFYKVIMRELNL